MDKKWIDRMYQFEANPSGGGGGETPPAEPSGGETPPEPSATPPPEPTTADGDVPVVEPSGEEPAPKTPPATPPPAHIAAPEGLRGLFAPAGPPPAAPAQPWTPPGTQPAPPEEPKAPPKVEHPTDDDWLADAGKAAKQQAAAFRYDNWVEMAPLRQEVADLKAGQQKSKREEFNTIADRVDASISHGEAAINSMYAEGGPLNSDSEFRNNPEVQKNVENIIGTYMERAIHKADRTGDTSLLDGFSTNPRFAFRVLAIAKADMEDVPEGALRPTHGPVGPQAPAPKPEDGLSAEDRTALAAARADGVNITAADMKKARELKKKSVW